MKLADWVSEVKTEMLPDAYQRIAEVIGVEATLRMAQVVEGVGYYFPKLDTVMVEIRNRRVREEFTGGNHKQLAIKYGVTERWIYHLVGGEPPDENQVSLFDDSNS